jgi:hypothetical protein
VLNESATAAEPYIAWEKEGRKYDLGALLITQQPGSIPVEILSQGDNWFIFHLLSASDLATLKRANAHFSDDLLSSLLNEPIPGQGVFWSSVGGKPYPVSLRALSFERMFSLRDAAYNKPGVATYAQTLRATFSDVGRPASAQSQIAQTAHATQSQQTLQTPQEVLSLEPDDVEPVDVMANIEQQMFEALRGESKLMTKIESQEGVAWGAIRAFFVERLPPHLDDKGQLAFQLVRKAMTHLYGIQNQGWESFQHPSKNTAYVRKKG